MREVTKEEMLERLNNDIACVVQRKLELMADGYDKAAICCDKNIQIYKAICILIAAHEPRTVTREQVDKHLPGCTCDPIYRDRGLIDHECHHHAIWEYLPDMLADLGFEVEP